MATKDPVHNINSIAAKAISMPSDLCTKQEAWAALERSIAENRKLSDEELARLYGYLMPGQHVAKPKTPERWVATAMADKHEVRYYLRYIYSDGSRIMATDGRRLHVYKTTKYSPGFYDAKMQPAECDGKFPNVEYVIPRSLPFETFIDQCRIQHTRAAKDTDPTICCAWSVAGTGRLMAVNRVYLMQALAIMPGAAMKYTDANSAIKLEKRRRFRAGGDHAGEAVKSKRPAPGASVRG